MPSPHTQPYNLTRKITLATLLFTILIGAVLVFIQIKPFWVDEWFIIDSLKTKNAKELFGQLDFMQQFPRVYLELLKSFTSFFNYSYYSLRLPSYLVSLSVILLSYRVMNKVYSSQIFSRYLFVLVLISSFTFIEYFVEMKQYAMDILMSVLALWQLAEVVKLKEDTSWGNMRYIYLCVSFFIAPFFSYTYPIAIVPVYIVVLLQTVLMLNSGELALIKWGVIIRQWLPLAIGIVGVFLFYMLDAKHLATDKIMYDRWSFLIMSDGDKLSSFFNGAYTLFSQTGNGIIYETLFGVLGIGAFIIGIISCVKNYKYNADSLEMQLRIYSCLLLLLTLILFLCKKLPIGTPRLNAFTTPAITILIIYLLNVLSLRFRAGWQKKLLPVVLYIGVIGNVFTHYINYFTSPVYKKQMSIYTATENAIKQASDNKIPILITEGVTYPYERATIDAGAPDPAVWVLKTFPAYYMQSHLPVYAIKDTGSANEVMKQLPVNITNALIGDGIAFRVINRN